MRNEQGSYDQHVPPDLSSSAAIGDYIQARTAAWTQHLQRLRQGAKRQALSKMNIVPKNAKGRTKGKKRK